MKEVKQVEKREYKMLEYVTVACSVPKQICEMLDKHARSKNLTRGGTLREILTNYLEEHVDKKAANYRTEYLVRPAGPIGVRTVSPVSNKDVDGMMSFLGLDRESGSGKIPKVTKKCNACGSYITPGKTECDQCDGE